MDVSYKVFAKREQLLDVIPDDRARGGLAVAVETGVVEEIRDVQLAIERGGVSLMETSQSIDQDSGTRQADRTDASQAGETMILYPRKVGLV